MSEIKRVLIFLGGGTHSLHSKISYNSLRKDYYSYGVIFNQFSNSYKVRYDDVSRKDDLFKNSLVNLKTFVKKIGDKNIFIANIDYDRRTSNYEEDFPGFSECKDCNLNRFASLNLIFCFQEVADHELKYKTKFYFRFK